MTNSPVRELPSVTARPGLVTVLVAHDWFAKVERLDILFLAPGADVENFYEYGEGHRCIDVALGNLLPESLSNQRGADEEQERQRQHLDRRVRIHECVNGLRRQKHYENCRHDGNHHDPDALVTSTTVIASPLQWQSPRD